MRRGPRLLCFLLSAALVLSACSKPTSPPSFESPSPAGGTVTGLSADAAAIASERGLSPADVAAALKTYVPSGKLDEAVMFASGGHSGQVIAIGIPSMRILKNIGVFTPESWQGWGYSDETRAVLEEGSVEGQLLTWGDTHHPNISETNGEYDGEYLFINDKANARIAVVDLKDWETKQIVKNPLTLSNHGATFIDPNTNYIFEASQYAMPWTGEYAWMDEYQEKFRGSLTAWKFDRAKGRIDVEQSFAIELPPYWQDLCDAGKGPSDGWVFCNSINTEMATGKLTEDDPYFETSTAARDKDYLHIVNWRKAEEVFKAGNFVRINDFPVIPIETAVKEGILFFTPEPKSPHGVDVTPKGEHIVVGGKLDPHVSIYSIKKIEEAIASGNFEGTDPYGVPIIPFDVALEAQIELGIGPLHTVFDDRGYAYTSLFIDSAVAKWSIGSERPEDGWKLIEKVPVQYNVGHLAALEGDTVKPGGKYLVALNKWSLDRFSGDAEKGEFPGTGPLLPQNLQLIDISGDTMQVIYDMPMGIGEPHYAQIIKADRLQSWSVYPENGWDPMTHSVSPYAVAAGEERIERNGNEVHIYMTAIRSHFTPENIVVKKGDKVHWHITNIDRAKDAVHGFGLAAYNVALSLEPGEHADFTFVADKEGVFPFYCTEFCSALHLEMMGYLHVEP